MKPTPTPPRASVGRDRFLGPDFLRGLGIILLMLTNVPLILTPIRYEQVVGGSPYTGNIADDAAIALFLAVPTMTGMGMFVLAMGQGFSQVGKNEQQFASSVRRLVVIGAVGLIHGFLIWWGDILVYYLVAGLVALYFRHRPPLAQIATGASIAMFPLVLTVADVLGRIRGSGEQAAGMLAAAADGYRRLRDGAAQAYTSHDHWLIVTQRVRDWLVYMQDFALVGTPQLVGLLLVGIGVARLRATDMSVLRSSAVGRFVTAASIVAGLGYTFQLAVQLLAPGDTGLMSSVTSCCQIFAPPVLAVVTYLIILRNEEVLSAFFVVRWLAVAGRYSLSIYVLTSLSCATLAYGFGLYGQISPSAALLIAASLCIALVVLCSVLQRLRRQGPMEAIVRALSRSSGPPEAASPRRERVT